MATIPTSLEGFPEHHRQALSDIAKYGDLSGNSTAAAAARQLFQNVGKPVIPFTGKITDDIASLINSQKQDCSKSAVSPVSITTGQSIVTADPCKDNFFDKTESALENLFDKITKIDGAPFNIAQEIKKVTGMIGNNLKPGDFVWFNIVDNDNVGKSNRVRFEYIYNSEEQILKGLDEFHKCAKFCTSEKPPKRQKRNDYESSNSRK